MLDPSQSPSAPRRWTRATPLDALWRRASFSAITREFDATSGPRTATVEPPDEPEPPPESPRETPDASPAPTRAPALADLPGGTRLGKALHQVLEHHDLRDSSRERLSARAARALTDHGLDPAIAPSLADALADVLATPLPVEPAFRLADIAPGDRLSELDFMLPLVGATREGPSARGSVTAADLADTLSTSAPAELGPWLDALARQPMRPLRGLLSGSIDAVLRGPDGRLWVVDWKSNHLGPALSDYAPRALWRAMDASHYHLQYLLYAVALRRHLRHRDPTIPPERFGGVLYCFLRGMHPENPPGTGVFAFRPPDAMLDALDRLLCPPLRGSPAR